MPDESIVEKKKSKPKPMVRLTEKQKQDKLEFIEHYIGADSAAKGSLLDANANVTTKTVTTLGAELFKDFNVQINRYAMICKIAELYGQEEADLYEKLLEDKIIYKHDESSQSPGTPYCVAINMYPFLEYGMTKLGGESKAPKHLDSYCGSFINLVFAIASQFAGAVATVEFLMYFDYFARKDYGDNYLTTHSDHIISKFQHVVYSLNQPAAARGYQSVFWNISIFDKEFFNSLFGNFAYPDENFTKPEYESVSKLQRFFMEWFLEERRRSLLTFPVITEASIHSPKTGIPIDSEFEDMCADLRSKGLSFFSYSDTDAAALASCCRMKNNIKKKKSQIKDGVDFSYSLGAGGISTGSTSVITINMNRCIQTGYCEDNLKDLIKHVHKFQIAHRKLVEETVSAGLLPAYTAGFIKLDDQYLTLGVLGIPEAAEFKGLTVSNNEEYTQFALNILDTFFVTNRESSEETGYKFNTELVPGENLGVKFAQWDKKDGLIVNRECYNSYLYLPEDSNCSIVDKFTLHGKPIIDHLDGGSAIHLNLAKLPDKEFFIWLRRLAGKLGSNYWTTNVVSTVCEDCSHIHFEVIDTCPKCGSSNISHATRVIGYLRKIPNYGTGRKSEALRRFYH